ncbi:rhodanese-like domain-containing protein [Desulfoplanes sp.]
MTRNGNDPHDVIQAPHPAEPIQDGVDRQLFYLTSFFHTSRELVGLRQPAKIMEKFLLMAMGPMGVSRGVIGLVDRQGRTGKIVGRNIPDQEISRLQENLIHLQDHLDTLSSEDKPESPSVPFFGLHKTTLGSELFPFKVILVIPWTIDDRYQGFLAFGEKITHEDFTPDERYILTSLVPTLTASLGSAILTSHVQQLNNELAQKNERLSATVTRLENKEKELDREVLKLSSLNGVNTELRFLDDPQTILRSFLLHVLGTRWARQGFIVLVKRDDGSVLQTQRGFSWTDLTSDQAENLLFCALSNLTTKTLEPLTCGQIKDTACFRQLAFPFPCPEQAHLFILDQKTMGLIGFSRFHHDATQTGDDAETFHAQMTSFMVHIKNVLAFETITRLNQNLEHRNLELQTTIDELTRAHQTIDVMEKTRERIRQTLDRESHRIQRATGLDFVLILIVAALLGLLFNLKSPRGISIIPQEWTQAQMAEVGLEEVVTNGETGRALLIDARPQEFFRQGHIPGAINLSPALFEAMYPMFLGNADLERPIIVYGRTVSRHYDRDIAYKLGSRDHEQVNIFIGGFKEWQRRGYPVSP